MQNVWRSVFLLASCLAVLSCASAPPRHIVIRNPTPIAKDVVASVQADDFAIAEFKAADGTLLKYRVLAPSKTLPGKTYPLVLQLHGSGGIGTDNVSQLDRLAKTWAMPDLRERYQTYVLIPQFPVRSANYGPLGPDQHAEPAAVLRDGLELVEDFASHHAVDKSRIYAVGFSMGGSGAWLAPTLEPNLFAAIVPISGIAPPNSFAPGFKQFPVMIIHGNADPENPIDADRRFADEVTRIGGKKILFREIEGLDHRLSAEMFPGYWWRDWLFEQSRQ